MSADAIMQALEDHSNAGKTGIGVVCACGEVIGSNDEVVEDLHTDHLHEVMEQIVSEVERDARIQALSDAARDIDLQVNRSQADIQDSYSATRAAEEWLSSRADAEM